MITSFAVPSLEKFSSVGVDDFPGEVRFCSGHIVLNLHRRALTLKVVNKADRPIQVSACGFFFGSECKSIKYFLLFQLCQKGTAHHYIKKKGKSPKGLNQAH